MRAAERTAERMLRWLRGRAELSVRALRLIWVTAAPLEAVRTPLAGVWVYWQQAGAAGGQ